MRVSKKGVVLLGWLVATGFLDPFASRAVLAVDIGQNFLAGTYGQDSTATPADANGAVGVKYYVEFINGRVTVFNKANGAKVQTMTDLLFWSRAGVTIQRDWDVTDPRLIYEPLAGRWFASQIDFDTTGAANVNHFLLAVSSSADPTGPWTGFSIASDPGGNNFADFPALGLDAKAVYLSGDLFDANDNPVGPTLLSIPKADLLAQPPSIARRTWLGVLNYATRGTILQPAVCLDGGDGGDILAVQDLGLDFQSHFTLVLSQVENAAGPGAATLSAATSIRVPAYTSPPNPSQPDSQLSIDDGDARFSALVCRVGDALFAVHSTQVDNLAAIRWYRINALNHALLESGTIADPSLDLFYPSIAANTNGTVVIAYNGSSSSVFISDYAVVGETVNGLTTFGSPILLRAGTASYSDGSFGLSRWGDYSTTTVDPSNPSRFWTIQMFPSGPSAWSTQVTEILTASTRLAASTAGANLVLSWSSLAGAFQLNTSASLGADASWSPVAQPAATNNGVVSVSVPLSGGGGFFRLQSGATGAGQ
jgi:hypothetical protein